MSAAPILSHRRSFFGNSALLRTALPFLILGCLFLLPRGAQAATATWDGGGVDNNWTTCANWSSDTCPTAGDSVVFSNTSTKDSVYNSTTTAAFSINSGYTGTISPLSATTTLTVTGTFTQAAGTFTASAATSTFSGSFTYSAGTFNHNSGTVLFSPANSATIVVNASSTTFNNVAFDRLTGINNSAVTLASTLAVSGNVIFQNSNSSSGALSVTSNSTATRAITVAGNIIAPSTSGTAVLNISDSGDTSKISFTLSGDLIMSDSNATLYGDVTFAGTANQSAAVTAGGPSFTTSDWIVTKTAGTLAFNSAYPATLSVPTGGIYNYVDGNTIGASAFSITGGTFNASSATTTIQYNFTYSSGTFNPNGGPFCFPLSAAAI